MLSKTLLWGGVLLLSGTISMITSCPPRTTCSSLYPMSIEECNSAFLDSVIFDTTFQRDIIMGQLIYSLPNTVEPAPNTPGINAILDSIFDSEIFIQNSKKLDKPKTRPTAKRCICDENIWLIEHDNLIGIEGVIAQSRSNPDGNEGGVLSPNFLIPPEDKQITTVTKDSILRINTGNSKPNNSSQSIKVAFLDTGINPRAVEDFTFGEVADPRCDSTYNSLWGWNMIYENNIYPNDDNGHGTLVYLAYKEALQKSCTEYDTIPQELIFIKTADSCGYSTSFSNACGIHMARIENANYINCSWGYAQQDTQIERAIYEAAISGSYFTTSAGNKGRNIESAEHYPSGFSRYTSSFLDPNEVEVMRSHVFEVSGVCGNPDYDPISTSEIPFQMRWDSSNYITNPMYAEISTDYQLLVDPSIQISINGTSYAAPSFCGALVRKFGNNPQPLTPNDYRLKSFNNKQRTLSFVSCSQIEKY